MHTFMALVHYKITAAVLNVIQLPPRDDLKIKSVLAHEGQTCYMTQKKAQDV